MTARSLKVADLFCGAGGASEAARRTAMERGRRIDLVVVNHWATAIETHRRNHPLARHYCQELATVRPNEAVPGGYLDLLLAGPTCTFFSQARGGKPVSDQQRMDPWHILPWMSELRVTEAIIENVPEFVHWGPIDRRTGRPVKSRRGEYFQAWVTTIQALGYRVEWRILCAADYGDATTRKRFFLKARSDRKPIRWPIPSHVRRGVPLAPGQQQWRAAREIIDWSIPGRSIFDRKTPLAAATLRRIAAGVVKFQWPEPFVLVLRNHADARGIDLPIPTLAAKANHVGIVQPFVFANRAANAPRSADDPIPGLTTSGGGGIAVVEPFIIGAFGEREGQSPRIRSIDEPAPTICAEGRIPLIEPFMLSTASGGIPRSVENPAPTFTGRGPGALVVPYYSQGSGLTCTSTDDPVPTLTTKERFAVAFPLLGEPLRDYDIHMRMLAPIEQAGAHSFIDQDHRYEFSGNIGEQTRQIGNSWPVRLGQALIGEAVAHA